MLSRAALGRLSSLVLLVALVLAWEMLARGSRLSALVLPAPSVIWDTLWSGLRSGYFWPHLLHTGMGRATRSPVRCGRRTPRKTWR